MIYARWKCISQNGKIAVAIIEDTHRDSWILEIGEINVEFYSDTNFSL